MTEILLNNHLKGFVWLAHLKLTRIFHVDFSKHAWRHFVGGKVFFIYFPSLSVELTRVEVKYICI